MARVLDIKAQETGRDSENKRLCAVYDNDPQVFPADKIIDIRAVTTEIEYCIKWTGYSAKYNEWVAEKNVTPDLKREFSIEKKKKQIKLLKEKKAKPRVMRKRHGILAKSSTLAIASAPSVVPSTSRNDVTTPPAKDCEGKETSLSVTMESKLEIPEWITPEEDESDTSMLDEYELEVSDTLMSVESSKPDVSGIKDNEASDTVKSVASSESDEAAIEVLKWSTSQQYTEASDTVTFAASSESGIEVLKWSTSQEYNVGNDTSMFATSLESNESGLVQERNDSMKMNEENCTPVSAILPIESTIEATRRELGVDPWQKEDEPEEWDLLGFNKLLEPVFI